MKPLRHWPIIALMAVFAARADGSDAPAHAPEFGAYTVQGRSPFFYLLIKNPGNLSMWFFLDAPCPTARSCGAHPQRTTAPLGGQISPGSWMALPLDLSHFDHLQTCRYKIPVRFSTDQRLADPATWPPPDTRPLPAEWAALDFHSWPSALIELNKEATTKEVPLAPAGTTFSVPQHRGPGAGLYLEAVSAIATGEQASGRKPARLKARFACEEKSQAYDFESKLGRVAAASTARFNYYFKKMKVPQETLKSCTVYSELLKQPIKIEVNQTSILGDL
jgi:hypothetical protein